MSVVTTIGADPARIDIDVIPGEPIDFTVPVYDGAGAVSVTGWTLSAQVKRDLAVLHTFTATAVAGGVRISATGAETALWTDWPVPTARWTLWITPPASEPDPFAAGWVRVTTH